VSPMRSWHWFGAVVALSCVAPSASALAGDESATRPEVRLVLQITVDGLRGDLLNRYGERFGEGGFRRLLDSGAVFTDAHHEHANTETIVGHVTLATGAHPSDHGMVGNVWFDREAGELAYNIEDPESPILPTRVETVQGEQLDPAQKLSRTQGRSPRAILAATLGDTLAAFTAGRARVFAVGGKDRSAVSMAGQVGQAYWYSTDTADFVTSRYYGESYPDWVVEWNAGRPAASQAGGTWSLLSDPATYLFGDRDDRPFEVDLGGYGRTFPHAFGDPGERLFATRLLVSPVGDRLTLDFAKALVLAEEVGQDEIVDYLSISFSGLDAVQHFFGPSSLEAEDLLLQLDRTLADLLSFVDEAVGREHTLVVLSADHGMAEMPETMTELGLSAGRLTPGEIVDVANDVGRELGIDGLVRFFFRPYLYLDDEQIELAGLARDEVERAVARALVEMPGIALAVPRSGPSPLEDTAALARVRRNFHPSRSGDIYVAQAPYWFLFEEGPVAAMHGSPWRYDTHVPLIFAGPGIPARRVHRHVSTVDVAPTLAALLGMSPPSSAAGATLVEVLSSN
jgi:predicted AlkP superfamily pyrophosphatase or phosphodiesterase